MTSRRPMPVAVEDRLIRAAIDAKPLEVCGFVLVTWKLVFMQNTAEEEGIFAMDDSALLEFYRTYGQQCIGMFHSHPEGTRHPSHLDAQYAPRDIRYWIATLTSVYEWDMEHDPPRQVIDGRTRSKAILASPHAESREANRRRDKAVVRKGR